MTGLAAVMTQPDGAQRRRANVRLALAHVLLALAFLGVFVWVTVHR